VVRGNLIVLPVGDSLIYLQPVYLQSKSAKFPAFDRIVVASSSHVVWGSTLSEALSRFLAEEAAGPGGGPTPSPSPTPSPGPGGSPAPSAGPGGSPGPVATPPTGDVRALIDYANAHFEAAQAALRNGEFARYGTEIELVRQALERLQALTGASAPLPSASAAP
jgi:uncharacterized membrane protein (UPF0182 family)